MNRSVVTSFKRLISCSVGVWNFFCHSGLAGAVCASSGVGALVYSGVLA